MRSYYADTEVLFFYFHFSNFDDFLKLKLPMGSYSIPETVIQACLILFFAIIECELIKYLAQLFENLSAWCIMLCAQCLERLQLNLEIC